MAEQQPQPQNSGQNRKKAFMIVAAVVAIGLTAGYFYNNYRTTHVSTDDAFVDGNIHTIAARVSGNVRTVAVVDNQRVKQGDVLVELDPADYRSKAEAARATLELQKATLRLAESELKRAKALYEQDVSSAERYDKAVSTAEISRAQVKLAEELLRQAELNLSYTRIMSPSDGFITKKSVQTGNQVKDGQPLMAVVELNNLYVVANYKETEMENIRPGMDVRITVDAYPGVTFKGQVDSIMAGTGVSFSLFPAENATGNYVKVVQRIPVKIVLAPGEDKDHILRIGMSVIPTVLVK
ncbi:MAG: HlyD family secretion protein [Nitrospirae bacterium]|nr:HlyD family secretion protein [Nitrospirota bacterium]